MAQSDARPSQYGDESDTQKLLLRLTIFVACILAVCVLCVAISNPDVAWQRSIGLMLLAALACAVTGGFFGFLFGMPRAFSLANPQQNSDAENADPTASAGAAQNNGQWANNNLLEVSDWLTKIVVGLTLVNLNELMSLIGVWGQTLGNASGLTSDAATVAGISVILTTFGYGFIGTYILTRTRLSQLLAKNFREINASLHQEVSELRVQQEALRAETSRSNDALLEIAQSTGGVPTVMAQLYRPKPQGFTEAIRLAENQLRLESTNSSDLGKLYGYLACAYGQKYAFEQDNRENATVLRQTADQAYDAAAKMIEHDPSRRSWLRALFDEKDPNFIKSENDLVALSRSSTERDRFAKLLSQSPTVTFVRH